MLMTVGLGNSAAAVSYQGADASALWSAPGCSPTRESGVGHAAWMLGDGSDALTDSVDVELAAYGSASRRLHDEPAQVRSS